MIRSFRPDDAGDVDRIAVQAFAEHSSSYGDWAGLRERLSRMSEHASYAEVSVAEHAGEVCGAVLYVAPYIQRPPHFDPDWAVIRMLVVDPDRRGLGLGRALVADSVGRAIRDGARVVALHTSPMMEAALAIYRRSGFEFLRSAPVNFGAPCSIFVKRLGSAGEQSRP